MKGIVVLLFIVVSNLGFALPNYAPINPKLLEKKRVLNRNMGTTRMQENIKKNLEKSVTTGELKAPVILIEFSDKKHSNLHDKEYYSNLLFSDKEGSMKDYYEKNSYGKLNNIHGEIVNWVESDKTMGYYGLKDDSADIQNLVIEAIKKAAQYINFSNYDLNNDGYVDQLIVIHSGEGEEKSGIATDIWSHEWNLKTPYEVDGVKISKYTMQSEYSPVGIFAHEFGHALGLPDLYNTTTGGTAVGKYSLMDYGSWNGPNADGTSPSYMSAWEKVFLGWITPIDLNYADRNGTYMIKDIEENNINSVYRIYIKGKEEYLLIANRQKKGYDKYLPGSGLLVYHIYEGEINGESLEQSLKSNDINGKIPMRVKVLEANGKNDLGQSGNDGMNYGDAGDYFNSSAFTQLLSMKNNGVNSCIWNFSNNSYGLNSGVSLTEISSSKSVMSFKFSDIGLDFNGDGKVDGNDIKKVISTADNLGTDLDYDYDKKLDENDLEGYKDRFIRGLENAKIW
ncbi:M6 family metalloprotease domain-containing protein [Haliovirga abyssi]|uniref:Peptidase M6-like domain-containing protein n=1 Tax=Haliovirga abyssi TaxID=2996794 RepID=A0AAU9DPA0_9FUSO|nr:M6 family metalloprotease domain-containing protein [Haliovirga abyssi]BDU50233.1 hypothetical protein HLVA_08020 [Haliovirga abyssi]